MEEEKTKLYSTIRFVIIRAFMGQGEKKTQPCYTSKFCIEGLMRMNVEHFLLVFHPFNVFCLTNWQQ